MNCVEKCVSSRGKIEIRSTLTSSVQSRQIFFPGHRKNITQAVIFCNFFAGESRTATTPRTINTSARSSASITKLQCQNQSGRANRENVGQNHLPGTSTSSVVSSIPTTKSSILSSSHFGLPLGALWTSVSGLS